MSLRNLFLACLGFVLFVRAAIAAPPEASFLFPAGGQVGQVVSVTMGGNFKPWPVQAWTDTPGLVVEADKEEGRLLVKIAAEVEPGLYWVRFSNTDGASPPRPFVVGTSGDVLEVEPNNELEKSQKLSTSPLIANGKLSPAGDIDTYVVELQQGQTLVADVDGQLPIGSPMDTILQLVDPTGFILLQNNDDVGLDPRIVFTAPRTGAYHLRLFGYSSTPSTATGFGGGENFVYRLTVTTGPFVDFVYPLALQRGAGPLARLYGPSMNETISPLSWPDTGSVSLLRAFHAQAAGAAELRVVDTSVLVEQEPNDRQTPQAISLPISLSGRCEQQGDSDGFVFEAKKGQRIVARIESRALGFLMDPVLMMYDDQQKLLQTLDDAGDNRDCELGFGVPADGRYRLVVRDLYQAGGSRYAYLLTMRVDEPNYKLTLSASEYVLAAGKTVEIPLAIDRLAGFSEEIEFEVRGLPEGVKVEAPKSPPTGDAAKSVKLIISGASQPFSGPLEIVGRSTGEKKLVRPAGTVLPNRFAPWNQVWLTITK